MSDGAVFERKEVKYRLSESQLQAVLAALEGRMAPDKYGRVLIESLYLDTPERLLIERSLDKPLYKEKLRVRAYGGLTAGNQVFVEVKKKFQGIVYKRRVSMSFEAACAYLGLAGEDAGASADARLPYEQACGRFPLPDARQQATSLAPRSLQIAREIDAFVQRYEPLAPSMDISCKRVAYAPVAGATADTELDDTFGSVRAVASSAAFTVPSDLRITFDTGISYTDLFDPCRAGGQLLAPGEAIMEIKNRGPYPLWLARALSAADVKPSSFSKYGAAYRACMGKEPRAAEAKAPEATKAKAPEAPEITKATKKGGRCA